MDFIRANVQIDAFSMQVQTALDTHIEEYKQQVIAEIAEQLSTIDVKALIAAQVQKGIYSKCQELVQDAFRFKWDLEDELRKAVNKMILKEFKKKDKYD